MRNHFSRLLRSALPLLMLFLAACGGNQTAYTVGGTLTGLAPGNSITLSDNGTDVLTLSADGAFTFPGKLANGASYKLTLSATTPKTQTCTASDSAGTINAANVTTLKVSCVGSAGLVQFVSGEVQQVSVDGQKHALQRGDTVNEGDTLNSSSKATAKFKMNDGGLITMRPDTQFKIDSYKFSGKPDGSEQSFYSVVKGGFRSITGLIGKAHKNGYRIVTPTAVLGIRGTDHEILFVAPGSDLSKHSPVGTYDKVNSGATTLSNDKGSIAIQPRQMGYVAAPDQKPVLRPVDTKLFAPEAEPFDGRWATKLVCDDTRDKQGLVKGYTWEFDITIEHGKVTGQYGQPDTPGSGTYTGQVKRDGSLEAEMHGITGKPEYTMGKHARGTPFSYHMQGKLAETTGHATRTEHRPCAATFTKH